MSSRLKMWFMWVAVAHTCACCLLPPAAQRFEEEAGTREDGRAGGVHPLVLLWRAMCGGEGWHGVRMIPEYRAELQSTPPGLERPVPSSFIRRADRIRRALICCRMTKLHPPLSPSIMHASGSQQAPYKD